ncbi:MAG: hypothetical protein Q9O62_04105 [Ardenticatenia bacterium]|nr:hypothetical protein [Ardenticatenia bacterium]
MNYNTLLFRAFRLVRTVPVLWQLGILLAFVGGGTGSLPSLFNMVANTAGDLWPSSVLPGGDLPRLPLVVLGILMGAGLVVVGLTVQYVARVGLIDGSARAHREEPLTLTSTLKRGLSPDALRLLVLNVLLYAPVMLLGLFIMALFFLLLGVTLVSLEREWRLVSLMVGIITGATIFLFIGAMLLAGGLATVLNHWSIRFVILAGRGVLESLQAGWRLFRTHWQASLILWLVQMGVNFALQIALTALAIVLVLILGGITGIGQIVGIPGLLLVAGSAVVGLVAWTGWAVVQGIALAYVETLWSLGWLTIVEENIGGGSSL